MEERIIKDINDLLAQLFQKMKELGYDWDDKKKELRMIEQKSTEWSEEISKYKKWIVPIEWNEEDKMKLDGIIAIVEEWRDNLSKKELEYYGDHGYVDWLKSLKERMEGK